MIFFNGLGIHLMFAVLAHLFSINMTWTATAKEVKLTNFFKELKLTLRTYKWMYLLTILMLGAVIVFRLIMPAPYRVMELWAIFPISTIIVGHLLAPIILNPVLMRITF